MAMPLVLATTSVKLHVLHCFYIQVSIGDCQEQGIWTHNVGMSSNHRLISAHLQTGAPHHHKINRTHSFHLDNMHHFVPSERSRHFQLLGNHWVGSNLRQNPETYKYQIGSWFHTEKLSHSLRSRFGSSRLGVEWAG